MSDQLEQRFDAQGREWRDPLAVVAQWSDASAADAELLRYSARGAWWDVLAQSGVTLIVSREYEHLVLAIASGERPRLSYIRLPHPSGIAFDAARGRLFIASTRNPNQIFEFVPAAGTIARSDVVRGVPTASRPLIPNRTWFLPGCHYTHELAIIGDRLHANSVGQNAVVALHEDGPRVVWWPASMEHDGVPMTDSNYIQLNSIAAGDRISSSFFSASADRRGRYRPGHPAFPVDGRGVIFDGTTREPIVRGLTRPHSARLRDGRLWVDNSGYGELGVVADGRFERIARLPGWTRGLAFAGDVAFVGTSRVIPRFRHYAPGLQLERTRCAIHAVAVSTGKILGSLEFPSGNQIFAIEPVPAGWTSGLPFHRKTRSDEARTLFYAYAVEAPRGGTCGVMVG